MSVVDEIDVSSLAIAAVEERFAEQIPEALRGYVTEHLDDAITEVEPLVKEQLSIAVVPVIDYLLGESDSLNVAISLEPIAESIKGTFREAFVNSPPSMLAGADPEALGKLFDMFLGAYLTDMVPSTFEINESMLGTEIPANIAQGISDAEEALEQARQYVGYFQLGYNVLIGFMVLMILGIILIKRDVRGTTRQLGITFLVYGGLQYASIWATKYLTRTQPELLSLPPQLQAPLSQLITNSLAPMEMLSLGILIGGAALLVVSFVYKRGETE